MRKDLSFRISGGRAALRRTRVETRNPSLFVSVGDAPAGQVVGRHLDADAVAGQDAYKILPHLAGDAGQYHVVAVVQAHLEESVRQFVNHNTFGGNQIVFSQSESPRNEVESVRLCHWHRRTLLSRLPSAARPEGSTADAAAPPG